MLASGGFVGPVAGLGWGGLGCWKGGWFVRTGLIGQVSRWGLVRVWLIGKEGTLIGQVTG